MRTVTKEAQTQNPGMTDPVENELAAIHRLSRRALTA